MSSIEAKNGQKNWYTRLQGWDNRINARLLLWLAAGIATLSRLSRGKARVRFEETTRFLRNLAHYIVQPETMRLMASPQLFQKALLEATGFTCFIALVVVWTLMPIYGFVSIPLLPLLLLLIVLSLLFTHLINLLALSGDVYSQAQDEGQRVFAHQTSASTLRFVEFALVALSLCLAFMPTWRTWAAIDLSVLVLVTRMAYLARLAQLRWAALALAPLGEDSEPLAGGR